MMVTRSQRNLYRMLAALIAALLGFQIAAWPASAEETVTSIQLDPVPTPIQLYVDDGSYSLSLWATIQGSASPRNVTTEAAWSSSSSAVKVDKGVLTAAGETASATITAKYKTYTVTATVKSDYRYAALKLKKDGADAPDRLDVLLGDSLQLTAAAVDDNGAETSVTSEASWLTSNANIATVSGGTVTPAGAGTVTLTAKYKGRTDTIVLSVTSPYKTLDITHSPGTEPIELNVGDADYALKAIATLKDGSPGPDVTADASWTTSNSGVVKVSGGVVTPVGAGSAVVTATRLGVTDAVTFYVRTPYEAMKVTTSRPLAFTLYGAPVELDAKVLKGTADPLDVTADAEWKVDNLLIAGIDRSGGKVTVVPKGVGSSRLTVSYKGLTQSLPLYVYPSIASIDIGKDRLDLFEGETGALPPLKGTTVAGDEIDVAKLADWQSSDSSILAIEDGKWTAKKTGTVTLKAVVENEPDAANSKKTDTIEVKVHKKLLTLIAETTNVSVVIGQEADLPKVTLIYGDGDERDVTAEMTWKSSSPNLLVKPDKIKGLLAASATLTGTYLNKTVTVRVNVEEEFKSFDIQPKSISLTLNRTQSIKVTGKTKSGKTVTLSSRLTWTSSEESFVSINGATVKGLAVGSGKLTATVQGKKLEIPFTVTLKLQKLQASATSLKMKVGQSETVKLTASYEGGTTAQAAQAAAWTTSNAKVATVKGGAITAVGKGTATVKATFGGKTATVRITVK